MAAYCRVSSDSSDQLNSFAVQVAYYTSLIQKKEGWAFAGVYADEAVTGTRMDKREGFQRLMGDCRAGKIDRVLTKSISRFARNTLDCIEAVRELQALGVPVEFEKEGIDTGKMGGEMLLSILGAAAQEESLSISKNLKWAIRKRMQAGEFIAGNTPFGYRLEDGALQPDPEEAPTVQEIFSRYLSGESPKEIADGLNARGDAPFKWGRSTIRYILSNEKYVGDSLLQKKFTPDALPYQLKQNGGQLPQYYIANSHQGIIPKTAFDAAQRLQAERRERHTKPGGPESPFSRKLYCGLCGSALHRHRHYGTERWFCYKYQQGSAACPLKTVYGLELQEAFLTLYNKLLANPGILETALAQLQQLQNRLMQSQPDIAQLSQEIASLAKQNHTLARLQSKGSLDPALFHGKLNANNQKLAQLQEAIRQAQGFPGAGQLDGMVGETKRLLALLKGGGMLAEFEPEAFRQTVSKMTAWPDRFQLRLVNGLVFEERRG